MSVLVALIAGGLWVTLFGGPGAVEPECIAALPERSTYRVAGGWGGVTRCEFSSADGTSGAVVYVPWREWAVVVLLAGAVGSLAALRYWPRHAVAWIGSAAWLCLAALVTFFAGITAGVLLLLPMLVAVALRMPAARRPRRAG